MVKVEGTLDEMYELFGDARRVVKSTKQAIRSGRKIAKKAKRPLNAWQKYVKANNKKFRYKSGAKKGQVNLKAMSRAFKKTKGGRKK